MADAGAHKAVRVRIEGRVQGVGFRAWLAATARGLGLAGWVANRRDGGVEAALAGPQRDVDAMLARCSHGPPAARVDMVKVLPETEPVLAGSGFEVRATR